MLGDAAVVTVCARLKSSIIGDDVEISVQAGSVGGKIVERCCHCLQSLQCSGGVWVCAWCHALGVARWPQKQQEQKVANSDKFQLINGEDNY